MGIVFSYTFFNIKITKMSEQLQKARASSKINPSKLGAIIYGSEEKYKAYIDFQKKLSENNLFSNVGLYELSRSDQLAYAIKNTQKWRKIMNGVDFYKKVA